MFSKEKSFPNQITMQNDNGNAVISRLYLHLICVSINVSHYVMKDIFDCDVHLIMVGKIALFEENATKRLSCELSCKIRLMLVFVQ